MDLGRSQVAAGGRARLQTDGRIFAQNLALTWSFHPGTRSQGHKSNYRKCFLCGDAHFSII